MAIASERGKLIFRKTERELLRLCSGLPADAVHNFRTTTRRLQTLLEELIPARDRNRKRLLKMLGRIRKRAGKVRDLDVQLAVLRSLKVPQEPRRKTQLTQALIDLRGRQETKLRKLLSKDDIREIRKRLEQASGAVKFENSRDPLAIARQILESVKPPTGADDEELLHRYRIVVKRARYVAEFAPSSTEATQFIIQVRRLQDALGNWHDWVTLTHTAVERLGDVTQSPLVAALHNVTRGKFRHAAAAISASQPRGTEGKPAAVASERSRKSGSKHPTIMKRSDAAA